MQDGVDALAGRRILVTGGTGFIGGHLVRALVDRDAIVHVLTSGPADERPASGGVPTHSADLIDPDALDRVIGTCRPEVVFHLAAFTEVGRSWTDRQRCVRVNVEGTANLLAALETGECRRIVHASTSDVYGSCPVPVREDTEPRPSSPYATSKLAAELFCRLAADRTDASVVQLRLFNTYGPGQSANRLIPEIITAALDGVDVEMTSGTQTREFNHVADIVDGLLLAAVADGVDGQVVNLGCGEETSIADVATSVLELMGDPIVARLGALPDRPGEIARLYCDPSKARALLGWSPARSLRDGLAETIEWYSSRRSEV